MSEKNPWKTLSSRTVYSNPWITVRENKVIRPDGKEGIYSVVDTRLATATVAVTDNDEIVLVGQYRYTLDTYSWEIVEGGSDPGEDPLDTAKRELKEETGLVAEQWEQMGGEVHLSNCYTSERGFLYLARGLTQGEARPDGTEELQVITKPIGEVMEMLESGKITDALSIMGLCRFKEMM